MAYFRPFLADKFAFYSTLRHVNEQRFCCFCFFSNQGNQVPNEENIAVRSSRKQPTENPAWNSSWLVIFISLWNWRAVVRWTRTLGRPAQLIKVQTYNLFSLKNVHINKENVNVGPDIIYWTSCSLGIRMYFKSSVTVKNSFYENKIQLKYPSKLFLFVHWEVLTEKGYRPYLVMDWRKANRSGYKQTNRQTKPK